YPFYTIGQRKGLEIAVGEPLYVTQILPETNTVVLGFQDELLKQEMTVKGLNLSKYPEIVGEMEVLTKVRYKHFGSPSLIQQNGDRMHVKFYEEVSAIAPGQSAVFYEGNDVIGGGFIEKDH
ncbi:aminomethyltransferase beta-barrel domain-containing protein, partial [Bacteroidota bacterium]